MTLPVLGALPCLGIGLIVATVKSRLEARLCDRWAIASEARFEETQGASTEGSLKSAIGTKDQ